MGGGGAARGTTSWWSSADGAARGAAVGLVHPAEDSGRLGSTSRAQRSVSCPCLACRETPGPATDRFGGTFLSSHGIVNARCCTARVHCSLETAWLAELSTHLGV